MSSQNAFPGPNTGRPVARPTNPERPRQPSWVHPQAQAAQPPQQANGWQQQPAQPQQGGFAQQGYGAPTPNAQADYGHWGELQTGGHAAGHADPYAPQFEPYVPTRPAYGHQQPAPAYGAQQSSQWSQRGADPRSDPRGFDAGAPIAPGHAGPQAMQQFAHGAGSFERPYQEPDLGHGDWPPQQEIGGFGQDPYSQQGGAELGFAQPENGELDPAYGEEDADYEDDYAPRGRRPLMIAAALIGAVLIGGGMAYGYKKLAVSGGSQGEPPVIKSEAAPSKTKPADAGGKQFPYSDTKIMGRLGDGTSPAAAAEAPASASAAADAPSADSASDSADDGGARKVATLVVGRDGSIQPPPAEPVSESPPTAGAGVPGTALVDVFGADRGQGHAGGPSAASSSGNDHESASARPVTADDTPEPPRKVTPVKIAKVNSTSSKPAASTTGSIAERDDAAAPPSAKKPKRVARAETTATDANPEPAPITASGGGAGFVAVLASVPRSETSRMDALKRFADMQQKYSTALAGKTPDVAEANLGSKGNYHRLIVGPPGSREQASAVCVHLKAEGYNGCWVTSY
ncbi:MAG TPA: SPOR domain-containing protein [Hyphomicrobium sp.]|uniref:SPOR domain-containing protein n=1 Tax=Hyphomicrobium sp. TaxID=82 RepID=UPI002C59E0BC|nr:SPOR domain-containing protein [Hyphomicrobium sp.]HXE01810.1 SPOR domain-containing protein [Hyphomicrobium sp.]